MIINSFFSFSHSYIHIYLLVPSRSLAFSQKQKKSIMESIFFPTNFSFWILPLVSLTLLYIHCTHPFFSRRTYAVVSVGFFSQDFFYGLASVSLPCVPHTASHSLHYFLPIFPASFPFFPLFFLQSVTCSWSWLFFFFWVMNSIFVEKKV